MKLSAKQREVLTKLREGDGSAYSMHVSLSTLEALSRIGLVRAIGQGHMASPRTWSWRITDAGRVAIARPIEVEIGWCEEDHGYIGTISLPPDGVNAWLVLHEEAGRSLADVEARLAVARDLPLWPCRYCSEWGLKQTTMLMRNGVCEACGGTKVFINPDYRRADA